MSISTYFHNGKKFHEVFVKSRNQLGKQIGRRKRGITSERKAKSIEFQFQKELDALIGGSVPWTWIAWHNECLKRMKHSFKRSTIIGYNGEVKKWLPSDWQQKELTTFTVSDVHELIFETLDESVSCGIREKVHRRVRRLFEMALEEGIIAKNPAKGIHVKVPQVQKKVLNATEVKRLLESAKNVRHRFYPTWVVALMTGMRSGEMYALRWSDIDMVTGLISVTRQWTSKDGLHDTKGNRDRVVPISPDLKRLFAELKLKGEYKETLWDGLSKQNVTYSNYVLPRLREWYKGEQAAVLKDFCRSIGITDIKFHDLRATFITNMLTQGAPLVTVMAIVGHRKMSTTDEYVRLAGVGIKGATERLGYALPVEDVGKVVQFPFSTK